MIVIIPCCGESQRYKGTKKQFLYEPAGLPLPVFSASGIKGARKKVYVFIEDEFKRHFGDLQLFGGDLCLLADQTKSQVETVVRTIATLGLQREAIYIKDCDNYFDAYAQINTSTVKHTSNARFKLNNKSYTSANSDGWIKNIAERDEISKYINVGGYGFNSGQMFLDHSAGKKFISEVILSAVTSGVQFNISHCDNYIDYGEQDDFDSFINTYR